MEAKGTTTKSCQVTSYNDITTNELAFKFYDSPHTAYTEFPYRRTIFRGASKKQILPLP